MQKTLGTGTMRNLIVLVDFFRTKEKGKSTES